MGMEVASAALIAASAIGGSVINSASSSHNTSMAMSNSAAENQKQRTWAEQQATIANQRNMENWREQFAAQSQQAQKFFDMYNSYNTPQAVVERLRQAGFNPSAFFQQGTGQGLSNFGNLSAPASEPHAADTPSAPPLTAFNVQPSTLDFTAAFNGISQAYEHFMSAADKSNNARRTAELLGFELKQMALKNNNQELLNAFQQVENEFQRENYPNRVQGAINETLQTASETLFNNSSAKYLDEQSLTEAFKRLNSQLDAELKGEELTRSKILSNYFEQILIQGLDVQKAQALQSRAAASESSANAATTNALRPFVTKLEKAKSDIENNNALISNDTFIERLGNEIQRLGNVHLSNENDRKELERHQQYLKQVLKARNSETLFRAIDSTLKFLSEHMGLSVSTSN